MASNAHRIFCVAVRQEGSRFVCLSSGTGGEPGDKGAWPMPRKAVLVKMRVQSREAPTAECPFRRLMRRQPFDGVGEEDGDAFEL